MENPTSILGTSANLFWGITALVALLTIVGLGFLAFRRSADAKAVPAIFSGFEGKFGALQSKYSGTASLKRTVDASRNNPPDSEGWLPPEREICDSFLAFMNEVKVNTAFASYKEYLSAANEQNREPMPKWVLGLFVVLVAAESYAFNLLLADYVAFGSTPQQQTYAAWGLCFLFSLAFVIGAHVAGRSWYVHSLAHFAFRSWQKSESGRKFEQSDSTIAPDQSETDRAEPAHVRILNRSTDVAGYSGVKRFPVLPKAVIFILTLIVVTMLGIFAFRVSDLNRKLDEAVEIKQGIAKESDAAKPVIRNGVVIPGAIVNQQKMADGGVNASVDKDMRSTFYWAFGIFSAIFLGVQLTGVYLAFRYGFASNQGEGVFRETHQYLAETEYKNAIEQIRNQAASEAQRVLSILQRVIADDAKDANISEAWKRVLSQSSGSGTRTFSAYVTKKSREDRVDAIYNSALEEKQNRDARAKAEQNGSALHSVLDNTPVRHESSTPTPKPVSIDSAATTDPATGILPSLAAPDSGLTEAKKEIERLREYLASGILTQQEFDIERKKIRERLL